jgi:hypothetical protein
MYWRDGERPTPYTQDAVPAVVVRIVQYGNIVGACSDLQQWILSHWDTVCPYTNEPVVLIVDAQSMALAGMFVRHGIYRFDAIAFATGGGSCQCVLSDSNMRMHHPGETFRYTVDEPWQLEDEE